jgi:hypothetical protein
LVVSSPSPLPYSRTTHEQALAPLVRAPKERVNVRADGLAILEIVQERRILMPFHDCKFRGSDELRKFGECR